ncbi:MAG: RNA-binding S4 domain-containing protein [Clostridium sp.]|nr:RNA-binding S4 domain-containing protein [Clostridium sp.]
MDNDTSMPTGAAQQPGDKKPKRPRIGQMRPVNRESDPTVTRFDNSGAERPEGEYGQYQRRPYQQRQGGYGQQRQSNFPRSPYYARQQQQMSEGSHGEQNGTGEGGENQQPRYQGYQQHQGGYQRQGGYNSYNNRQGGYQQRQGGYNNNRQGGYGQRQYGAGGTQQDENGGYQGGYQRAEGGYQRTEGGYSNNRQGGYNRQGQQRQGGYNNNRQGGYNNRQGQQRQGGYNNNRKGGYNRQGGGMFPGKGKSFVPRPKQIEYEMPIPDPNETVRLNKFMANAGICSRREADEYIQQGLVKVNGQVVTELGTKIKHSDVVEYDEKVVALERKCYILLNKPKDCVTTSDDPNGRTTVMDLVKGACSERIYPVGRLDRNTTGVLLLTNDGDLASKLTHPKYTKKKIYHVWTDHDIAEEDMQRIADGIELEDGEIHADAISYATETDRNQAGIEIHSGRNRIVRRIFEALGYHVTKLDRVYFAGLTKKNLPRGRWRYLTQEEVNYLKMGSFE